MDALLDYLEDAMDNDLQKTERILKTANHQLALSASGNKFINMIILMRLAASLKEKELRTWTNNKVMARAIIENMHYFWSSKEKFCF
jgi:hypothetical protein